MSRKRIGGTLAVSGVFFGLALMAGGCGSELETGYKYRPLNASSVQRRGYYASPYSAEKSAAEQEQKQGGPRMSAGQ